MDGNWRPDTADGVDPNPTGADWHAHLQPEARSRIVNKIMETLKIHLPLSVPEGLNELRKIAVQFEEKIYTAATNQSDYLRKISLKMLSMEMNTQQASGNAQAIPNQNNSAPGPPSQVSNQAQTSAIPSMSQQQARPDTSTSVQASSLTNIGHNLPGVNQTSTMQNESDMLQNTMNNGLAQVTSQDIYAAQRQMAGRQQQHQSQQLIYHQQQMPMKRKLQQNSVMQPHIQQQQQRLPVHSNNLYMPLHHPHQLDSQANISSLQEQQKNQQLLGTVPNVSNMQWTNMLQTKAQKQQHAHQPPMDLMQPQSQHTQLQQSQHLMSKFQSQRNQLQQQLRMQQQSSMQQRLQTSGGMFLQQNNMDKQKQFIQAQRRLQEVSSSPSVDSTALIDHVGAGDWQEEIYQMIKSLKGQYFAELNELFNKISVKIQHVDNIIPPQKASEHYDRMKSFKLMLDRILQMLQINKSAIQPAMRDKLPLYEKQITSILNSQRRKPVQLRIHRQFQPPEASAESTTQTGHAGAGDYWQEEIYQMIKILKDHYFAELSELYNKVTVKLHHVESIIPSQMPSEQHDRMKCFKIMLDRVLQILQISKSSIQPSMRDKIPQYEKQIISIFKSQRRVVQRQIPQQFEPPAGQAPDSSISQQQQPSQNL